METQNPPPKELVRSFPRRMFSSPAVMVVVAFAVRMALLYHSYMVAPTPRFEHLPMGYEVGRVARSIAAGHGFSSPLEVDTGPTAWFAPVYPYLLAGVFKIFGIYSYTSNLVILTLNSAFSALACWPIFLIGRRVFSSAVGVGSGWLWVFLPSGVYFPVSWVWDTGLSAFLLSLIVCATLAVRHSVRPRAWIGYGALWAVGVLTNPSLLSLLPFLLVWLGFQVRKRTFKWGRLVSASALTFLLAVSPWIARNYLVFGKFLLFRSNFGLEFYLGNNEQVPDSWSWWLHPNDNDEEREKFHRMGEIAYMEEKQREGLRFVARHPADVARFTFHRFINTWTGLWDPIADIWSLVPLYVKIILATNSGFSLLSFLGLFFAVRRNSTEAWPFSIALLVFPLAYYISHTSLRYRHPIDPVMTVLAVYAVGCVFARLAQRFSPRPRKVPSHMAAPEKELSRAR